MERLVVFLFFLLLLLPLFFCFLFSFSSSSFFFEVLIFLLFLGFFVSFCSGRWGKVSGGAFEVVNDWIGGFTSINTRGARR